MGNSEAKPPASPITPSDGDSAPSPLKRFANSARRDDPPNPEPSGSRAPAGKEQEQAAVQHEYPRRTGVPDCFYYVEFGSCKYGMNCKFNHPLKPSGWPAPAGQKHEQEQEQEYPRRPGEPDCAYYVRFGSCRYGMNCKFNHPLRNLVAKGVGSVGGGTNSGMGDDASSSQYKQYLPEKACMYNHHGGGKAEVEQVKLNFLGLPVRPGTRVCSYYMCWGTCKYGSNCKFHHPEPESEHENWDASRHAIQGSPQLNFSSGLDQEALKEQPVPFLAPSPSCRSGIIQPQGVYPYPERSGYQMDENKQGKPHWDPFSTKVFCDICADEVLAGNRPTNHLNAIGYNNLCAKFNEKTKKGYNHEQFKSKWEQLKKDYQMWKALMESEACLGWDPKKNIMSASPEWWAEKMKAMPDCEKFHFAPLENVDLLNIMFEDMLDSSSTAPEANLAVNTTIRSDEGSGGANDIGIIDKEVNEQSEEATSQKSSNKEPKSTKPKTNYVHAALNHLVDFAEMVNPSNSMTSKKIDQVGCGISEIMELVVDAGAGEGSDEHFIATQLFIRPEYREMFLTLKTPQGRLVWLRRMCQEKEK